MAVKKKNPLDFLTKPQPTIPQLAEQQKASQAETQQSTQSDKLPSGTKVNFKPGGGAKYTDLKGRSFDLSDEELKQIREQEGTGTKGQVGQITDRVKDILAANREARAIKANPALGQPVIEPPALSPDAPKQRFDALDAKSVIGGATAGAGTGGAIGTLIAPGVGMAIGGAIGAVSGATAAFFYSSADERRQATLTGVKKFRGSTGAKTNMAKLLNTANAGGTNPQQLVLWWEYEKQRIYQAQREVDNAGSGMFGKKLAKNTDEAAEIQAFIDQLPVLEQQFYTAIQNPNPNTIYPVDTGEETITE